MKRDSMLSLWILGRVAEADYDPSGNVVPLSLEGSTTEEISYHVLLLGDAGFIEVGKDDQGRPRPVRLTWKGHDYLDTLGRNSLDDIGSIVQQRTDDAD